jgi:tRNA(Leu) C34 or U34 (ribose-2'-O)-methylase TrmL
LSGRFFGATGGIAGRNNPRIRLPMMPGNRRLNLSNTVAVVYEVWRRNGYAGGG